MSKLRILIVLLCFLCTRLHSVEDVLPERHPNIVVFLVDNLGIEDLSCYGASSWRTPNIDRLGDGGVKFTRLYSETSEVASRSSVLTGLLPTRTGMIRSSFLPFETFPSLASTGGLQETQITLAEVLKRRNFSTAFIGHWGLGLGRQGRYLPINQGFDYWYGVPNIHTDFCRHGANSVEDRRLWSFLSSFLILWTTSLLGAGGVFWYIGNVNWKLFLGFAAISGLLVYVTYISLFTIDFIGKRGCVLYRNGDIIEQPYTIDNMTLRFTREAVKFVKESSAETGVRKPFFLFLSYMKMHHPIHASNMFREGDAEVTKNQALSELDWSVGKIMDVIQSLGIDEDTMVILTSTRGHTSSETERTFQLKGVKPVVWEGVLRVPALIRWTGKLQAGRTVNTTASLKDLMPTLLELTNQSTGDVPNDGLSLLPVLFNSSAEPREECLFHYTDINKPAAVSCGPFKVVFFTVKDDGSKEIHKPPLLYDIETDPGETTALPVEEHSDVFKNITDAVSEHLSQRQNKWISQLESPIMPFLFPCANFPSCLKASTERMDFTDLFRGEL